MEEKKKRQKSSEYGKFKVLFRILELLHHYENLQAGQILQKLVDDGLLSTAEKGNSVRRLLNYYLKELEYLGFIEKRGRGRNTTWKIKRRFIYDNCALLPHQKGLLLLLILIGEETLLKGLNGEVINLVKRLGLDPQLLYALKRDICFKYIKAMDTTSILHLLGKIAEALQEGCYIQVFLKGEDELPFKLKPLGLGIRGGKLYLVAEEVSPYQGNGTKFLPLDRIQNISLLRWEKFTKQRGAADSLYMLGNGEKPFIFGLQPDDTAGETVGESSFHPFIFHVENKESGKPVFYLIGFNSNYFATCFLPHLGEPVAPHWEMLKIARQKGISKLFPKIPLEDLTYHRKLYIDFLKLLRQQLTMRLNSVKKAWETISTTPS